MAAAALFTFSGFCWFSALILLMSRDTTPNLGKKLALFTTLGVITMVGCGLILIVDSRRARRR